MKTTQIVFTVVAMTGAAVGQAGPALADPPSGSYTGTVLNGSGVYEEGSTAPFTMNSCGPECLHLSQSGSGWDLHRQGGNWVGSDAEGTESLDENALLLTLDPTLVNGAKPKMHVVIQLAKNG